MRCGVRACRTAIYPGDIEQEQELRGHQDSDHRVTNRLLVAHAFLLPQRLIKPQQIGSLRLRQGTSIRPTSEIEQRFQLRWLRCKPCLLRRANIGGDELEVGLDRLERQRFGAVFARFRQIEIG